ncbi:MAG: SRPBCC domain-containing protein [Terriglobales bacterium]
MATATVMPAQDAIVAEIFIAAPPERVFQAITDPQQASRWWGQPGLYRITGWKGELRTGGKWQSTGVSADGTTFQVEGEYLEVDPPRLLVHTWNASWCGLARTVVRWELEPRPVHGLQHSGPQKLGTGTLVRIRHDGFDPATKAAADHGQGWIRVLGWMQAFVERGETVDTRSPISKP